MSVTCAAAWPSPPSAAREWAQPKSRFPAGQAAHNEVRAYLYELRVRRFMHKWEIHLISTFPSRIYCKPNFQRSFKFTSVTGTMSESLQKRSQTLSCPQCTLAATWRKVPVKLNLHQVRWERWWGTSSYKGIHTPLLSPFDSDWVIWYKCAGFFWRYWMKGNLNQFTASKKKAESKPTVQCHTASPKVTGNHYIMYQKMNTALAGCPVG